MRLTPISMALAVVSACAPPSGTIARGTPATSTVIYRHAATTWFEEQFAHATSVSPSGERLVFESRGTGVLVDTRYGVLPMEAWAGVDEVTGVVIRPSGEVAVRGRRGRDRVWVERDRAGRLRTIDVPAHARPVWSADGLSVAYQDAMGAQWMLHIVVRGVRRVVPLPVRALALGWMTDASALLVMLPEAAGGAALYRMNTSSGALEPVARQLDASPRAASIAVARDGRHAFLALASGAMPLPDERHIPHTDRDLDIYAVDLGTGARRVVAATPGDDAFPMVAGNQLYWTSTRVDASVVVLPVEGGAAHRVVDSAQTPTWHPNARQIGFAFGDWRAADLPLNWDGGTVEVDSSARAVGRPGPLIVGYHEDFAPVWSPNGRWIAYHSHRTARPAASGAEPGTDDIYVRAAGAPLAEETRLTDFGLEAGSPDWSPEGTRLVFTTFDRAQDASRSMAYVVTMDTAAGRATAVTRVPLPPEVTSAEMVAWSPNGDTLAIEEAMSPNRHALWIMSIDGTGARKLVDYPMRTYGGVDWTPDGATLVYSALSGTHMQLFSIPATGGVPRRLTSDDGHLLHPQVSPNGRYIAATRLVHHIEVRRQPLVH